MEKFSFNHCGSFHSCINFWGSVFKHKTVHPAYKAFSYNVTKQFLMWTKWKFSIKHGIFITVTCVSLNTCFSTLCPLSGNHVVNLDSKDKGHCQEDKSQWPSPVLHNRPISSSSNTLWDLSPHFFLPTYFSNACSSPLCRTACSCIGVCCVLTQPKPGSESLCQLAFGKWKEQTCQNVGKCKTGLERRTPSPHIRHLGPKSSWHWAGSMWDPSWVCLTHSIADTVLSNCWIFLVVW